MIAIPARLPDYTECRPVLKWAGGKGQLLEQIEQKLPLKLKMNGIKRYIEPFVGGSANPELHQFQWVGLLVGGKTRWHIGFH